MAYIKKYGTKGYITQEYIDTVEHYLYNNIPLENLTTVAPIENTNILKDILKEGEEWAQLPESDSMIVTSFGRFLNMKNIKQIKPTISPLSFHVYVHSEKVDIIGLFKKFGWKFDLETIRGHYLKYKWRAKEWK